MKFLRAFLVLLGWAGWTACPQRCRGAAPVLQGGFHASTGAFDGAALKRLRREASFWDTYGASAPKGSSRIEQGPFTLGNSFALYLAGGFSDPNIEVQWKDLATGRSIDLEPRFNPGGDWTYFRWTPPRWWRGRKVMLIAEDRAADDWLGISSPVTGSAPWLPLLGVLGLQAALFVALLLPGAAWANWRAVRTRRIGPCEWIAEALIASGVAAYGCFWAYFANPRFGVAVSYGLLAVSAAIIAVSARLSGGGRVPPGSDSRSAPGPGGIANAGDGGDPASIWRTAAWPLAFAFVAGLMYTAVLLLYGGAETPLMAATGERFVYGMPPDAMLPYFLSQRLFHGQSLRPFFGDWLSSDRPPLQAGFELIVSPLVATTQAYQLVGTVLQTWIYPALWVLLRSAGVTRRALVTVLFFVLFNGFVLFNSTYVWPKLLPAAYLVVAASYLFSGARGWSPVIVGLASGLALLGHGGSAFALIALAAWYLFRRCPGGFRCAALGSASLAVLLVPWSIYQTCFDPPGNRLLKWHLAGDLQVDSRGFWATLRDSYRALTFRQWVAGRVQNVTNLVDDLGSRVASHVTNGLHLLAHDHASAAFREVAQAVRLGEMQHFVQAPGVLLVGFPALLWRWPRSDAPASRKLAIECLVICAICLAGWCVLMFRPGSTANHQGTYFCNLCFFVALALGIRRLPLPVAALTAFLKVAFFVAVWVVASEYSVYTKGLMPAFLAPEGIAAGLMAAAACALLWAMGYDAGATSGGRRGG